VSLRRSPPIEIVQPTRYAVHVPTCRTTGSSSGARTGRSQTVSNGGLEGELGANGLLDVFEFVGRDATESFGEA